MNTLKRNKSKVEKVPNTVSKNREFKRNIDLSPLRTNIPKEDTALDRLTTLE